jgi:hypothetical protein
MNNQGREISNNTSRVGVPFVVLTITSRLKIKRHVVIRKSVVVRSVVVVNGNGQMVVFPFDRIFEFGHERDAGDGNAIGDLEGEEGR